jgi:asparagine synthase (glutamine-hydrolysing)
LNAAEHLLPLREAGARANNRPWVKLFHLTSDEEIIDADLYTWWDRYRGIAGGAADPGVFQSAMTLGTTLSEKAMLHDLSTYLPDDVLTKVDRASMAVSLETRAPLLDYRIVELALRLPLEFKLQNGNKKRILKDLLSREIPETLIGKKKMGFRIPFARWMREDYGDLIRRYFSDEFLRKQDLFDRRQVKKMQSAYEQSRRTDFAREVWTFLLFQLWYDHYVN